VVGAVVGAVVAVVAVGVAVAVVAVAVGVGDEVGVAVAVGVGVQVGVVDDVGVLFAVAAGCVPWLNPVGWDAGVAVGFFAGVFEALVVAVGVAGGFVVSPARDAVGVTFGEPCELDSTRTATTAMMTAAAAPVIGQRHRLSRDRLLPGGIPPVPPPMFSPAAVNGPDTGTRDVSGSSGPGLRSTRVAETESAAADTGMTGSSVVGS
jgi:hypothetical protein